MQDSLDDSHFDSETLFTQSMGPFSFLTLSFSFWDSLFSLSTNSVREPVLHATCGFRDGRSAWDMSAMSPALSGRGPEARQNRASKWAYKKKCLKLSKWATTFNMNDFLEAGYAATPPQKEGYAADSVNHMSEQPLGIYLSLPRRRLRVTLFLLSLLSSSIFGVNPSLIKISFLKRSMSACSSVRPYDKSFANISGTLCGLLFQTSHSVLLVSF